MNDGQMPIPDTRVVEFAHTELTEAALNDLLHDASFDYDKISHCAESKILTIHFEQLDYNDLVPVKTGWFIKRFEAGMLRIVLRVSGVEHWTLKDTAEIGGGSVGGLHFSNQLFAIDGFAGELQATGTDLGCHATLSADPEWYWPYFRWFLGDGNGAPRKR